MSSASGSPRSEATGSPAGPSKKRGRPARAKKAEESSEPKVPKKRGPKPKSAEEKARIKEEKKQAKIAERKAKREAAKKAAKEAKEKEKGPGRGKGRRAKVPTEDELAAKEELKKQRYEEFKRQKLEKAEKRLERNAALREYRRAKKDEEKRKKEAFEKRMQALKASFLDENSHLSAAGAAEGEPGHNLDETSQSSMMSTSKAGRQELSQLDSIRNVTSENLFEYKWPPMSKSAEHYFLQEQVCEYLGIKSFKRKYPNIYRYE